MFKDDYRRELDQLTASEKFKQNTISLMQEKQKQLEAEHKTAKIIKFRPKPYRKIAASVAVLVLAVGAYAFAQNDFAISMDNAETETIDYLAEQAVEKPDASDYHSGDASPTLTDKAYNEICRKVYTIDDAEPLESSDVKGEKIYFNTDTESANGFEGLMFYDISEFDNKNPFSTEQQISTLPVYEYTALTVETAETLYLDILSDLGLDKSDIHYVEYEWAEMMEIDESASEYLTNNTEYVICNTDLYSSPIPPYENSEIFSVKLEFDKGYIEIQPVRGLVDVYLYTDVPDEINKTELGSYLAGKYPESALNSYVVNDYNIYGEQNDFPTYVFDEGGSYAEKIFNYSVGSSIVWYSDSLWQAKNDKGENIHIQYTAEECYNSSKILPAINWQEALDMLYNGEYLSSVPEEITDQSTVAKIDLVYKEPPCFMPGLVKKGYAVPFYKFYIPLSGFGEETDNGTLTDYGVYYVCAIHPDYIELTENYAQFN